MKFFELAGLNKMRSSVIFGIGLLILFSGCIAEKDPAKEKLISEVPIDRVEITDGIWRDRIETNQKSTIPHLFKKNRETGRIANFERAAADSGRFTSMFPYDDTDVYKMIEGAAYTLMSRSDPKLEQRIDSLISIIAAAQEEDGYLYTYGQLDPMDTEDGAERKQWRWGDGRWEKVYLHSHELYNAGHLIEAGVAWYHATGRRELLDVAIKFADLISETFGPGPEKQQTISGHQEVELALVRLYEVTGKQKYLETADFFLEERGNPKYADPGNRYPPRYRQNFKPVKQMDEAWGHSVRAAYMLSGMIDVGVETDDEAYLRAADAIWNNVVNKKLYLIGGIGASGHGEGFGQNYDLPNASSYNESCAAIGNVFWNHRMFKVHGDARYIDVMERSLYNNVLSGVSLEGDRFFYYNRLESDGELQRQEWFDVACCPGNLSRAIPSVPKYIYGVKRDTVYVNLFIANKAQLEVGGRTLQIEQETKYPWEGDVNITVRSGEADRWTMKLRIPGWARSEPVPGTLYRYEDRLDAESEIRVNGETWPIKLDKGYAVLQRRWEPGDQVELHLPMEVRKIAAHDSVEVNRHKFALERGPIVYTAESVDNGENILDLEFEEAGIFTADYRPDFLGGIVVLQGKAHYEGREQPFMAIPYYAWAHRGAGKMAVWQEKRN